ncbi:MAG: hypothetical protein R3222_09755 [Balneolaceae bacterium]|nr:hypothetical protein [Balneolaceae bacterium]
MQNIVRHYVGRLTKISILILCAGIVLGVWIGTSFIVAFSTAFLLSYLFVSSNFFTVRYLQLDDHKKFYRIFLISLAARFILVIAALIFVLEVIKIHQIFFTVSFIISYIFHSVIEIIFINQILETDS